MVTKTLRLAVTVIACLAAPTWSFINPPSTPAVNQAHPHYMFFADEMQQQETPSLRIAALDGNEDSIRKAAAFMIDAFWLQSPQAQIPDVTAEAKTSLIASQANDLWDKYGERMGKRKLDAIILSAADKDDADFLGLLTIEVRLLDSISKQILNAEKSEFMLNNAISSLGPKQRREYKDASVIDVTNALLPPEISAVCSLSNLCVSTNARRRGIAAKLCKEAESLAKELGFDEMHLCVEVENEAASMLYKEKLGYGIKFETMSKSLRVNGGEFVEIDSEIAIMSKKI